jgi:hypothetical protein
MRRFIGWILGAALLAQAAVAGVSDTNRQGLAYVEKMHVTWSTPTNLHSSATGKTDYVRGQIARVVVPINANCTGATYSVTMLDDCGKDVLQGKGTAIATGSVTEIYPSTNSLPYIVNDRLLTTVTNCGASASGTIILYVR